MKKGKLLKVHSLSLSLSLSFLAERIHKKQMEALNKLNIEVKICCLVKKANSLKLGRLLQPHWSKSSMRNLVQIVMVIH